MFLTFHSKQVPTKFYAINSYSKSLQLHKLIGMLQLLSVNIVHNLHTITFQSISWQYLYDFFYLEEVR